MENLNKIVSLSIGLVFVILVLGALTGKIDLKSKLPNIFKTTNSTAALSPTPKLTITPALIKAQTYRNNSQTQNNLYQNQITKIPETGSPSIILPLAMSGIFAGFYLKKRA